ncbi:Membrane protein [Minicystis rosea]|nr:Membrane protein [Minicystis rosea]
MRSASSDAAGLRTGSDGPEVERLQRALNSAGAKPPLRVDGRFEAATDRALRAFQASHRLRADGIAGPRTWRALDKGTTAPASAASAPSVPEATESVAHNDARSPIESANDWSFPLAFRPSPDWHSGARYFGARRDGGKRRHAGCDLLGPVGSQIYAIADGTLVRGPYYFYSNTYAIEVRHGPYIVRYGEILGGSYVGGQTIRKGQPLCKIGRLSSGSSMLHFEMYSNGKSTASLTGPGAFKRRADLMDPTKLLDEWVRRLPR